MNLRQLSSLPVAWILRSPLHRPLSNSILLMNMRGEAPGTSHTFPVSYVTVGDELLVVSRRADSWWRGLVGGALVEVRIEGDDAVAHAEVLTDPDEKRAAYLRLIKRSPQYCKQLGIVLTPSGKPANEQALQAVAEDQILVRLSGLKAVGEIERPTRMLPISDRGNGSEQAA